MCVGFFSSAVVFLGMISTCPIELRFDQDHTKTVSSLSPTFLSLSLPSSICLRRARVSSLYRRISLSASSRPTMALFRAASLAFRSSCLPWKATELKAAIFSCTELSRSCRPRPPCWLRGDSSSKVERGRWFARSGDMGWRGDPDESGNLEGDSMYEWYYVIMMGCVGL